jgi:hypothetical protein
LDDFAAGLNVGLPLPPLSEMQQMHGTHHVVLVAQAKYENSAGKLSWFHCCSFWMV